MSEESYRRLAEHLDRLPGGFPPSESGAELRLLEGLCTPAEADLAIHLTLKREEASAIAQRAEMAQVDAQRLLDAMADKGLVFAEYSEAGPTRYSAVPWVVGIYEFQVNNLTERFLGDMSEYYRTRIPKARANTIPQMRIIPVGESISPHLEALPYEAVREMIEDSDRFAVAPCICRRKAKLTGGGCDAPEESCLLLDDWAEYYVRTGRGRSIDRSEVWDILARADAANLVLQPTNSQDIDAICCCCGCCCGLLRGLQRSDRPAEVVASAFIAQLDADACLGCWTCLERCQMGALAEDGDRVTLNVDRCIGCGLCVTTCPSEALTLMRKAEAVRTRPPATWTETWIEISRAQAELH